VKVTKGASKTISNQRLGNLSNSTL